MIKKSVAIIGVGSAGLTAAYQFVLAGVNVELYEGSDAVGGVAKTFKLWG